MLRMLIELFKTEERARVLRLCDVSQFLQRGRGLKGHRSYQRACFSLSAPPDGAWFILAIVEVTGEQTELWYARRPFGKEPDFRADSVNYSLKDLLQLAEYHLINQDYL